MKTPREYLIFWQRMSKKKNEDTEEKKQKWLERENSNKTTLRKKTNKYQKKTIMKCQILSSDASKHTLAVISV